MFDKKFAQFGSLSDLDMAIQFSEQVSAACSSDHPGRAMVHLQLASVRYSRFRQTDSDSDYRRALETSLDAWSCPISPPQQRIDIARLIAALLTTKENWKEASPIFEEALRMLPQVSPQFLRRGDQEHVLARFAQLAANAISTALNAGSTASHCLSLLELGRGIIMGLVIDSRSDISDLHKMNPNIYERFNRLRMEIDSPMTDAELQFDQSAEEDRRRRRVQAIQEIDDTVAQIRQLPGFEGFQLPPTSSQLITMGGEGPIVVFNATELRSDAIIITSTDIKSLNLPKLIFSEVEDQMKLLSSLVRGKLSTYSTRNAKMEKVLRWLWKRAVKPVLDELGFGAVADDKLPRVWWIGVGPLARAPFHAAGDHSRGSTRNNTFSRVISSYIPTIKALSYARQKRLDLSANSRLFLIAMPTTPAISR